MSRKRPNLVVLKMIDGRLSDLVRECCIVNNCYDLPDSSHKAITSAIAELTAARSRIYDEAFQIVPGVRIEFTPEVTLPECSSLQTVATVTTDGVIAYESGLADLLDQLKDHLIQGRATILPPAPPHSLGEKGRA